MDQRREANEGYYNNNLVVNQKPAPVAPKVEVKKPVAPTSASQPAAVVQKKAE